MAGSQSERLRAWGRAGDRSSRSGGADGFCVATPLEAREIASSARGRPVLVLGAGSRTRFRPFWNAVRKSSSRRLILPAACPRRPGCWPYRASPPKVDTGMGRIGFDRKRRLTPQMRSPAARAVAQRSHDALCVRRLLGSEGRAEAD